MSDPEGIESKVVLQMRKDYRQHLINVYNNPGEWRLEDIWVQRYFGKFSGCEVVYMGSHLQHTAGARHVEIAGYTFVFSSSQEVYAYKDSMFYTLNDAYTAALLTKEDIYEIGKQVDPTFLERHPNS